MTTAARFNSDHLTGDDLAVLAMQAIHCSLLTSAWTPNVATQDFWNDISANETSGTGYTADGVALSGKVAALDGGGTFAYLDADDPSWTGASIAFRYAVFWVNTGTPSTSPLIGYMDLGGTQTLVAADFVLELPAPASGGLLKVSS